MKEKEKMEIEMGINVHYEYAADQTERQPFRELTRAVYKQLRRVRICKKPVI